jgi:N-acetylglutamate synthase-like GNAT family acetyltransferase
MEIKLIDHGSPDHKQMIGLRMEILRAPLGLSFTKEQLDAEKEDWLIGAFDNNKKIIGCCVLTRYSPDTIQLRQMAVKSNLQSSGIGKMIVAFAENLARENGFSILMMHARNVALGFYQKCGYTIRGNEFIEVTVPHHYMEKQLT